MKSFRQQSEARLRTLVRNVLYNNGFNLVYSTCSYTVTIPSINFKVKRSRNSNRDVVASSIARRSSLCCTIPPLARLPGDVQRQDWARISSASKLKPIRIPSCCEQIRGRLKSTPESIPSVVDSSHDFSLGCRRRYMSRKKTWLRCFLCAPLHTLLFAAQS